jgi:hypothetical protein
MATVSELIAELNKFDPNLTVSGAENLSVAVISQTPVMPAPAPSDQPG